MSASRQLFDLESIRMKSQLGGGSVVDVVRDYEAMRHDRSGGRPSGQRGAEGDDREGRRPRASFANLVTTKSYTPVPDAIDAALREEGE